MLLVTDVCIDALSAAYHNIEYIWPSARCSW